jgi:hypothetical protein
MEKLARTGIQRSNPATQHAMGVRILSKFRQVRIFDVVSLEDSCLETCRIFEQ